MRVEIVYSTVSSRPADRATDWAQACGRTYFPLEPSYRQPERFSGSLRTWGLGRVQASRYSADAALYRRRPAHLRDGADEQFLLTFPQTGVFRFQQRGRDVHCAPGGFFIERSNEPYVLSHETAGDLFVAKVSARDLEMCLPHPERYCAICFDSDYGVGGLLRDLIHVSEIRAAELTIDGGTLFGQQLIELLALAVESNSSAASSCETSVRLAHLQRINAAISSRYAEPDIAPGDVAAACGISVRYLHDLCRSDGASFRDKLRRVRLNVVQKALRNTAQRRTITEIALAAGFSDLSSFSRTYRQAFGETPRETQARAFQARDGSQTR